MKKRLFGSLGVGFFALGLTLLRGHQEQAQAWCGPNGIYCTCSDFTNWNQTGSREQVGTGPINTGDWFSFIQHSKPAFGIDNLGNAYITTSERQAASGWRISVYRYSNGTWNRIGLTNFLSQRNLSSRENNPSLDIDNENNVYVATISTGSTGSSLFSPISLSLFKYNPSLGSWTILGTYGPNYMMNTQIRTSSNGNIIYVAYYDNNSNINVIKYMSGVFTHLGIVNTGGVAFDFFDIEIDGNNTPYVAYIMWNAGFLDANVKKYANNQRQQVGSINIAQGFSVDLGIFSSTGQSELRLLVDKKEGPTSSTKLLKFANTGSSQRVEIFSTGQGNTGYIFGSLDIDTNNNAYISLNGNNTSKPFLEYLHRFHLSPYRSASLPGGHLGHATLKIGPNNIPYIAIHRSETGSSLEVRRIKCSTPTTGVVNGSCGSANGVPSYTQPYTGACATGNLTGGGLSGSTRVRQCQGSNGGTTASCSAPKKIDAVCGVANGGTFSTFPDSSLLCSVGSWSNTSTTSTNYYWQCDGINGGLNVSCQANVDNCYPGSPNCR